MQIKEYADVGIFHSDHERLNECNIVQTESSGQSQFFAASFPIWLKVL